MRDVWYSVGLKGSGTNNIVVDPIFVPAEYTLDLQQARDGTGLDAIAVCLLDIAPGAQAERLTARGDPPALLHTTRRLPNGCVSRRWTRST